MLIGAKPFANNENEQVAHNKTILLVVVICVFINGPIMGAH